MHPGQVLYYSSGLFYGSPTAERPAMSSAPLAHAVKPPSTGVEAFPPLPRTVQSSSRAPTHILNPSEPSSCASIKATRPAVASVNLRQETGLLPSDDLAGDGAFQRSSGQAQISLQNSYEPRSTRTFSDEMLMRLFDREYARRKRLLELPKRKKSKRKKSRRNANGNSAFATHSLYGDKGFAGLTQTDTAPTGSLRATDICSETMPYGGVHEERPRYCALDHSDPIDELAGVELNTAGRECLAASAPALTGGNSGCRPQPDQQDAKDETATNDGGTSDYAIDEADCSPQDAASMVSIQSLGTSKTRNVAVPTPSVSILERAVAAKSGIKEAEMPLVAHGRQFLDKQTFDQADLVSESVASVLRLRGGGPKRASRREADLVLSSSSEDEATSTKKPRPNASRAPAPTATSSPFVPSSLSTGPADEGDDVSSRQPVTLEQDVDPTAKTSEGDSETPVLELSSDDGDEADSVDASSLDVEGSPQDEQSEDEDDEEIAYSDFEAEGPLQPIYRGEVEDGAEKDEVLAGEMDDDGTSASELTGADTRAADAPAVAGASPNDHFAAQRGIVGSRRIVNAHIASSRLHYRHLVRSLRFVVEAASSPLRLSDRFRPKSGGSPRESGDNDYSPEPPDEPEPSISTHSSTDCPVGPDLYGQANAERVLDDLDELFAGHASSPHVPADAPSSSAILARREGESIVAADGIVASSSTALRRDHVFEHYLYIDSWTTIIFSAGFGRTVATLLSLDRGHSVLINILSSAEQGEGIRDGHRSVDVDRIETFGSLDQLCSVHVRAKTASDLSLTTLHMTIYHDPSTVSRQDIVDSLVAAGISIKGWSRKQRPSGDAKVAAWLKTLPASARSYFKEPDASAKVGKTETYWQHDQGVCDTIHTLLDPRVDVGDVVGSECTIGSKTPAPKVHIAVGLFANRESAAIESSKLLAQHGIKIEPEDVGKIATNMPRGYAHELRTVRHKTAGAQALIVGTAKLFNLGKMDLLGGQAVVLLLHGLGTDHVSLSIYELPYVLTRGWAKVAAIGTRFAWIRAAVCLDINLPGLLRRGRQARLRDQRRRFTGSRPHTITAMINVTRTEGAATHFWKIASGRWYLHLPFVRGRQDLSALWVLEKSPFKKLLDARQARYANEQHVPINKVQMIRSRLFQRGASLEVAFADRPDIRFSLSTMNTSPNNVKFNVASSRGRKFTVTSWIVEKEAMARTSLSSRLLPQISEEGLAQLRLGLALFKATDVRTCTRLYLAQQQPVQATVPLGLKWQNGHAISEPSKRALGIPEGKTPKFLIAQIRYDELRRELRHGKSDRVNGKELSAHHAVEGGLVFLAVLVGTLTAALINYLYSRFVFARTIDKKGRAPPELRLVPMMLGGVTFPIGFFLLGWGPIPVQIVGLGFVGVSFLLIFQAGINYLIDAYTQYSASAVAANTFLRSIFAAAFPLVAQPLYHNLGTGFACTLLGCIAVALAFVPFLLYKFGPKLRSMSTFAKGDEM